MAPTRRTAAPLTEGKKEATLNIQETTPNNRGPIHPSVDPDVPSTPKKMANPQKRSLKDEYHLGNSPRKRGRLHPIAQLSHLKVEVEHDGTLSSPDTAPRRSTRVNLNAKVAEEEALTAASETYQSQRHLQPEVCSTSEPNSEEDSDQEQSELSAYERERLRNITENTKFLNSIKLLESAASLWPAPQNKNRKRGIKRVKPPKVQDTVVRRSMRLQRVDPSGVKLPEPVPVPTVEENPLKPPGPLEMIPINNQENHEAVDQFLRTWASISQERVNRPDNKQDLKRYEDDLKKLRLIEQDVAKVVPHRILSVAVHPSETRTLVAAGDKWGNVGLWDLDDKSADDGVYVFALHSRSVGCVSFSPSNTAHLLSISYDGTLRCGDVTRNVFDEIVREVEESFSSFDFLSADGSVLIVTHWDSQLSLVDRRTPKTTYEQKTSLSFSTCRTVSVHPLKRDLCVAAGTGGAAVYDVRWLRRKKSDPVVSFSEHMRSVASAYFSPVTGNRILATCADDRLRVFDSSSLVSKVPLLTSIRHNNHTGRWLTRFQAVWDPSQEDCFVVGSMARPRQIEVFHESGELVHFLWDAAYLSSVCSINAMHPSRSLVVGGNSSGRLHVFC